MPLIVDAWEGELPEPILQILGALTGVSWQAHEATGHVEYPRPGTPMRVHHHRWTLSTVDGSSGGGVLRIEEEEGGLSLTWSTFEVRAVALRLSDGRRIFTEGRYPTILRAEGFSEARLRAAALASGVRLRQRAGAG